MSPRPTPVLRTRRRPANRGFTLVEMLFAIVLSGMIAGVLSAAMVTALRVSKSTTDQVNDSSDTGLISAFLIRDAQSSGGVNPTNGQANSQANALLGVAGTTSPDWGGCSQVGTFVVRFSWMDWAAALKPAIVVTYALVPDPLDGTRQQLVRRVCSGGSNVDVVLARRLTSAVASCLTGSQANTSCGGLPTSVSLSVSGSSVSLNSSGVPTPFSATLTASFRSAASQFLISGPASLPNGQAGVAYQSTRMNSIGIGTAATWVASGLPAGLTIDPATGVISGTPSAAGNFTVIVTATDPTSKTTPASTASKSYSITMSPVLAVAGPATLPVGQSGVAYAQQQMTLTGGTAPYLWTPTGLPAGLALSPDGKITGTPTVSGTFPVTVTVTDAAGGTASKTYSLVVTAALAIATASLPAGQVGLAYASTQITSSGGTSPYAWSATGLPAGLTFNTATQTVAGSPTTAGTSNVTVTVTDAAGGTNTKTFSVVISPLLAVATATLPGGQVGVAYSTTVSSSGGTAPYTWTASGLPPGLTFNASTQKISGTPTTAGTYSAVKINVTDGTTAVATKTYTVTIAAAVAVCPGSVVGWRGEYYNNMTLTAPAVLCRDDADPINFNWGSGSPDPAVTVDNFSARWTRTQNFAAGYYTFTLGSDDGGRLYIDGAKVIDSWVARSYATSTPYSVFIPDGSHTIVMEYYEQGGSAQATLTWVKSTPPACAVAANGWLGQYFSNVTLTGPPVACRDDADPLNFNWGGAPVTGMASDNFSVSWTKSPTFTAGTYNFALGADDGARLYIDNTLVLDDWSPAQTYPTPQPSVNRTLTAGVHALKVEYYEVTGASQVTLVVAPASPPPAPTLAFSAFTNTYWSGTGSTVFYRSLATSGSFTTTATSTDATFGITSYAFPALGTNWSTPPPSSTSAAYTYSWSVSPPAAGTKSVTATNGAGLTSAGSPFTFTADDAAPTNGAVTYPDGPSPATTVNVSFTTGVDAGSGVGTRLLQRQSANLVGSTCGTYGSFATLTNGTNPTSPVSDTVVLGNCYRYQYLVNDNVGNQNKVVGTSVVKVRKTYFNTINDTPGVLSYWRLGEQSTLLSSDIFTGTTGALLQSHATDNGGTWIKHAVSSADAVFTTTATGRIRKDSTTSGAIYYSSAAPAAADYTVEADVYVASSLQYDRLGVVGRLDSTSSALTAYAAVYDQSAGAWALYSVLSNNPGTPLATFSQTLTVGATYRLVLEMNGSTIRVLVDGTQRISVSNTAIAGPGRGGIVFGFGAANTAVTNIAGMHLDNFRMSTIPSLADSRNVNNGTYLNGPTLGAVGAISASGDSNTAATFDGYTNYGTVLRQISGDFSIEFWFKSVAGGVSTGSNWWEAAGMVDAEVGGSSGDFGVALRTDGRVVAGDGAPNDTSIVSTSSSGQNGNWHQVVFTRTQSTGVMVLYVDGVSTGTATGGTALVNGPAAINFGRTQSGTQYFAGSLDEVAIYTSVLDQATVTAHFNAAS